MIELPNRIEDELTLALVKAQLPPGLAIAMRPGYTTPRGRLYVGACVRRKGAMAVWDPHKDATEIVVPDPQRACTQCGVSAGLHAKPQEIELRQYDNTVVVEDGGETFILRR